MVMQCSYGETARKDQDIYCLWFITVASVGYKTDFKLNNIIDCDFLFLFLW